MSNIDLRKQYFPPPEMTPPESHLDLSGEFAELRDRLAGSTAIIGQIAAERQALTAAEHAKKLENSANRKRITAFVQALPQAKAGEFAVGDAYKIRQLQQNIMYLKYDNQLVPSYVIGQKPIKPSSDKPQDDMLDLLLVPAQGGNKRTFWQARFRMDEVAAAVGVIDETKERPIDEATAKKMPLGGDGTMKLGLETSPEQIPFIFTRAAHQGDSVSTIHKYLRDKHLRERVMGSGVHARIIAYNPKLTNEYLAELEVDDGLDRLAQAFGQEDELARIGQRVAVPAKSPLDPQAEKDLRRGYL